MLLAVAASASFAQNRVLDDSKPAAQTDCGSVVIVKCNPRAAEEVAGASAQTRQQARRTELRRQTAGVQQLDGVVIEGDAIRRRSIEEIMGSAFPIFRPRDGSHTFEGGDGSKCTCLNVCPPPPLQCCQCTPNLSRYRQTPGSSPLN